MTLRDELLAENHNDPVEAAAILALRLTRDDPTNFKVGYSVDNAILAALDMFPEVTEGQIRYINNRHGWMAQ